MVSIDYLWNPAYMSLRRSNSRCPPVSRISEFGMDEKENLVATQAERKRPRGKWKDAHVVLFVLLVVLTILFPGGGIFYLCGRFSPYALVFGGVVMLYLAVCVFILYCFVTGIVELAGRRGKRTRDERLLIATATGIPLIFVGLFLASSFFREASCGPGAGLLIVGLRDRIESKADIGATRAWLQSYSSLGVAEIVASIETRRGPSFGRQKW